ncbi:hypothetical protein CORC01_07723 [Colletotrichum orchidophilum]|uniref:AB hydrolase-1 domain-containing protein n=1 Tax=Colletotrichum orchidophilum TaxID=1209926 RepID=A0A1G4B663_9PEZI|nr:uncharacterized protein CORC01_07723 [Colletotrichum orchidophilum]OHE96938.1 hypothetical protein CORC01_07723 [Colletotrichum orchidophilum]
MSPRTPPTFLLVPGSWHRPWSYDLLRDDLHGRGFSTETVTLACVGSTDANVGLEQDTAAVRTELQKLVDDGREVVVVAHSYGGVPTANAVEGFNYKDRAAQKKTGGVLMVVYMASFAISAGSSLSDGAGLPSWWDVKDGFISPLDPIRVFYADVKPALAAKAVDALRPQPLRTFLDKSGFEPWNEGFEMGYIFAENDQAIPLDLQITMASQFSPSSFTASLSASHSPFLSMPKDLGEALQQAAKTAVAKTEGLRERK